jgi:hypothetical protein
MAKLVDLDHVGFIYSIIHAVSWLLKAVKLIMDK